jgi:hypothetical protein
MTRTRRVADLQAQQRTAGRVRMGYSDPGSNGGKIPRRSDTFILTSTSRPSIAHAAALYGGDVVPFGDRGRQWAVRTATSRLRVMIPPGETATTEYEWWNNRVIRHRCDGRLDTVTGQPCVCPQPEKPGDPDSAQAAAILRATMARNNPPRACKLVTRLSFYLPELIGLGTWRLDTGSYYAALETIGQVDLLADAAAQGILLPADLYYDWRQRGSDGREFPVPVVEILESLQSIASGQLAGRSLAEQVTAAARPAVLALEAGAAQAAALPPPPPPDVPLTSQQIAARLHGCSAREFSRLAGEVRERGLADDWVDGSPPGEQPAFESLGVLCNARHAELIRARGARQAAADGLPPEPPDLDEWVA